MKLLKFKIINSPVGHLKIVVNERALLAILWDNEKLNRVRMNDMVEDSKNPIILETERQLKEYFHGKRTAFNIPLETHGTPFQQGVWELLNEIPYGMTWSYKDIANKMNRPQAFRAIGAAVGKNPISIILPCHRVIASNGSLTGFAGGLDRKKILLDLEGIFNAETIASIEASERGEGIKKFKSIDNLFEDLGIYAHKGFTGLNNLTRRRGGAEGTK